MQKPVPVQDEEAEAEEAVVRPGELYRRYRTVDELPENARAFYKLAGKRPHWPTMMSIANIMAATEAGTSLEKLTRAVFVTEVMIDDWMLSDRKKRFAQEDVGEE